jgi:TonB-dependent SusC/RagA subfamily outer membrane receptor
MKKLTLLLLALLFIATSCGTTSRSTDQIKDKPRDFATLEEPSQSQSLIDHLRRIPSINIRGDGPGAQITIRGISSMYGSNEPLFVVNGQALSGGLREAMQAIPVANIKTIRVLKNPDELGIYGVRGANGVILIQLK